MPSKVEGSLAKAVSKTEKTTAKVEPLVSKTTTRAESANADKSVASGKVDKGAALTALKDEQKSVNKTAKKAELTDKKLIKRVSSRNEERSEEHPRSASVPPPPPDTPSLMSAPYGTGSYFSQQYMPFEMMSPESLKTRQKELTSQLENAKTDLKSKQTNYVDRGVRAQQFVELFNEGVISRRESESSQEEIKQSKSDLDLANAKVQDVQYALQRIDDKIKHLSKYVSKTVKASAKKDGKNAKSSQSVASKAGASNKSATQSRAAVKDPVTASTFKSSSVPTDDKSKSKASVAQPGSPTGVGTTASTAPATQRLTPSGTGTAGAPASSVASPSAIVHDEK